MNSIRHLAASFAFFGVLLIGGVAPASVENVVYYDMTSLSEWDLKDSAKLRRYWDESHLVTSLQGLVNRDEAKLFVRYNEEPDDFWWKLMRSEGEWLADSDVKKIEDLNTLLETFVDYYNGAVVYDERVPATSNLASTIAGVDSLLAVRYDENSASIYQELVNVEGGIPVQVRLLGDDGSVMFTGEGKIPGTDLRSSGSAKNDAYRWLIETYIKTGKVNPLVMGYYIDAYWFQNWRGSWRQNHTLNNHDYIIANGGVLFDLNVWEDETPVDDRGQEPGTDMRTLQMIMRACYDLTGGDKIIHVAGFVPWAYKYTEYGKAGGTHHPVASEWRQVEILSCFNAYSDADALSYSSMANASFYQHYPLPEVIPQNPRPTLETLKERGLVDEEGHVVERNYYANYQGDYDAAAWLHWKMPEFWNDPARGEVPMTWPFNPNLAERFPLGMAWIRKTRTENDFFVAGDSGAGYVNPYHLSAPREFSGVPSGLKAWEEHCERFYSQWDISATGFIIDGNTPGMTEEQWDAYARFSHGGIVAQRTPRRMGLWNGTPFLRITGDLPGAEDEVTVHAQVIESNFRDHGSTFNLYRSVLKTPSHYVDVYSRLKESSEYDFELVDLYTLMELIRLSQESSPYANSQAAFVSPEKSEGVTIVPYNNGDGPFRILDFHGVRCWETPAISDAYTYLYFDLDDAFASTGFGEDDSAVLEIEFWNEENGDLILHFDSSNELESHRGLYATAPEIYARGGSASWRKVRFTLREPKFANRQNLGADFRLATRGDEMKIRSVKLLR